jgi:hypothetical protein
MTFINLYGSLSAAQLRNISRADEAWESAYRSADKTITLESLKQSCKPHLTIRGPYTIEPTPKMIERVKRMADELGIPDSLEPLYEQD